MENKNTLAEALGIEIISATHDKVVAKMPVDHRTKQPFGVLHGGASAALAETVASIGSYVNEQSSGNHAVGTELSISHLRAVTAGFVIATATPIRLGRTLHVWKISIQSEDNLQLIAESRCTLFIRAASK